MDNGALVRVNDAGRAHGVIVAQQNGTYDWTRAVPTLVMRNEDYGRISRAIGDGTAVTLRVNIQNKEYPEGTTVFNAIGEIPGTDKKDEIVMLGGHYDSWHDATGATDNGIGSSMMLEAVRILAALHVKPRRTIRVALWSGEEEGLLARWCTCSSTSGALRARSRSTRNWTRTSTSIAGPESRGALAFSGHRAQQIWYARP